MATKFPWRKWVKWSHSNLYEVICTVGCRYNAVQYDMILHTAQQSLKQKINQLTFTKDTPYLTLTGKLWCVYLRENWLCYNGTVLYYSSLYFFQPTAMTGGQSRLTSFFNKGAGSGRAPVSAPLPSLPQTLSAAPLATQPTQRPKQVARVAPLRFVRILRKSHLNWLVTCRVDFRFAPSQWETPLLCSNVSHWLGASLESALHMDEIDEILQI